MFHGSHAQSTQKETMKDGDKDLEVIRVPDITTEALNHVLTYIYSEKVELEINNVFNVLYAAKKYLLTGLERECAKFLEDKVDAANVCYILTQAVLYENERLIQTCESIISFATADVVTSEEFKSLDEPTLARILQFDKLKIGEWTLFQEVLKWAEVQCVKKSLNVTSENKRLVLGTALYAIRFPAMRATEFAAYAKDKKNCILSERECLDLLLTFFYTLDDVHLNDTPFNHEPRGFDSNIDVAIYNSVQSGSQRQINGKHSIGFLIKSNAKDWFWLTGFGIYGTTSQAENVEITISVEKDDQSISKEVKNITNLYIENNTREHRVDMTRPVAIHSGARYVLNVEFNGHYNCYYGSNNKMSNKFLDPKTNEEAEINFLNVLNPNSNDLPRHIARLYLGI
uniref:BACK domain-containing protein n=1 Tax=Acrobeloides nanus TaxID=290746 RepID=A0A914CMN9_9BILA